MSIAVTLEVAIFLLGAAAGALLTRLQWRAFKQKVSQEMMKQFGAEQSLGDGSTKFHHPSAATFIPYVSESPRALVASPVREHISSDVVAAAALERLLEQHQMEIAGILREVQASWDAIGASDNDPEPSKVFAGILQMIDRACKSNTASWSSSNRTLKPH